MCTVNEYFVSRPNLPEGRVTLAAVSGQYPNIIKALEKRGIRCITTEPDGRLQTPVQSHADRQMFHLNDNRTFVLKGEQALKNKLEAEGFMVAETVYPPTANYPGDVPCNALSLGDKLFASMGAVDNSIFAIAQEMGLRTIHVSQGYTRCSTAVINDSAFITMDGGIGAAGKFMGVDIMIIPERRILLPGYDYGFIGGCCGLIDKNVLAFTGRLDSLDFEKPIIDFLQKYNVQAVELTQEPIIDIGGILPLKIAAEN